MLAQERQPSLQPVKGQFYALRGLGLAFRVPCGEATLGVGVDQEHWPVSGALGLNGKVLCQHRFRAAALLRVDYDYLHVFMLL
jgi:hypothetical protein